MLLTTRMKHIVFTDLDGTLLDPETYSWEAARPAIMHLRRRRIPLILVSSKTRAEIEWWRKQMDNRHPFIVENGGAAYLPPNYFSFRIPGARRREPYEVLQWGKRYRYLVSSLRQASRRSRCPVRGFHDMTALEISRQCGLSLEQAALAKLREYDEPFRILSPDRAHQLLETIEKLGLRWTRGGRFWHITGANDKALAVLELCRLFQQAYGPVRAIGLGDALNDAPFLSSVSIPVLVRSRQTAKLKALLPGAMVTDKPGPAGWSDKLLQIIP
jgi:mannosyl-3-phosphoglycerate phosphatase